MRKVLVLDDEVDMDFLFHAMFETEIATQQLRIDFYSNPKQCLDSLDEQTLNSYQYILSDINMPQINGPTFAQEVRRRGYQGPIGFISAYDMGDYLKEMKTIGISDFLSKPLDFKQVRSVLAS